MCTPATRAIGSGADRGRILGWFRVAEALTAIPAHAVILDAELCLLRADGSPDFYRLQAAIGGRQHELAVFGFDLLHLDGEDLRSLPLVERRTRATSGSM